MSPGREPAVTPSQPPRPGARLSKSRSASAKSKARSPGAGRTSASPNVRPAKKTSASPVSTRAQLAWLDGVNSPKRPTPSPKRKLRRGNTPPVKRTTFVEHPEQQPVMPIAPLTPISWDVDAAKAAGTQHPSGRPAPQAGEAGPETNASVKKALKKQKMLEGRRGFGQKGKKGKSKKGASSDGAAAAHNGAEGKGARKGGKGKGRGKPGDGGPARVVFKTPSKDAKGGGKQKAK